MELRKAVRILSDDPDTEGAIRAIARAENVAQEELAQVAHRLLLLDVDPEEVAGYVGGHHDRAAGLVVFEPWVGDEVSGDFDKEALEAWERGKLKEYMDKLAYEWGFESAFEEVDLEDEYVVTTTVWYATKDDYYEDRASSTLIVHSKDPGCDYFSDHTWKKDECVDCGLKRRRWGSRRVYIEIE